MITFILTLIGTLYIRLLGLTTRVKFIGEENLPPLPFIYAFWHSRLMFLISSHRGKGITVLISLSRDGEIIARVLEQFGFSTIRGSDSSAGGRSAVEISRRLRKKSICAITPDGPRGPKEEVKLGLPFIAKKMGCPVLPITYSVQKKRFLNSWDKFVLPLPFNRAVVVTGVPLYIRQDEELSLAAEKIKLALNKLTVIADRMVNTQSTALPEGTKAQSSKGTKKINIATPSQ